ncbi:hypothetical protein QO034_21780 [Sedimentitalea sp. JM2-8]|uniref:TFIIB zinc-binding n=1 Tax=Sedimentitalea xiamensis TaxID=3050037 RepID=A0ABT7FKM8_9RHOB|nr:hypothetical protein [Sedimentitalea xiamensis]MDK3075700.1 hypothetical protein [Sedimentitalea xiamensis]
MPQVTKIATCCYCGTRAALVLAGKQRHELACSSCGAPLHNLKMLRADRVNGQPARERRHGVSHAQIGPAATWAQRTPVKPVKTKPRKRRKGLMSKLFEEAFDVIEDLLD